MILGESQQFASPEEALEHFGVKGMRWGIRRDRGRRFAEGRSYGEPYSRSQGLGHGSEIFDLKKPDKLRVETRGNVIDVRPRDGFRSKNAENLHNEMVRGVEEMSKEYPALRNMKIEITPMSHQKGMGMAIWSGVPAAAAHLKPGEVRLFYNDRARGSGTKIPAEAKRMQPGLEHSGFLGRHELGHVLAMTGGALPSGWKTTHSGDWKAIEAEHAAINQRHKELFKKHGLTFKELSSLSPYAATEPGEALAELSAYYNTPALRSQIPASTQAKAKALLDDIGGKKR